jgi:hypothetical protein
MRRTGQFRHVAETALHGTEEGDSNRMLDLARSRGGVAALLAAGVSEDEIGLTALAEAVARRLPASRPWWWAFRISLAVR